MATRENPHAGQGPVVLDIGGNIGALIVAMPPHMVDLEIEIITVGTDTRTHTGLHHPHTHAPHSHDRGDHPSDGEHRHHDDPHGDDARPHDHSHDRGAPPHVAVVARPAPDGSTIHCLVYGELLEGDYDLYVRPSGPVRLTATVIGGQVTDLRWPDWDPVN